MFYISKIYQSSPSNNFFFFLDRVGITLNNALYLHNCQSLFVSVTCFHFLFFFTEFNSYLLCLKSSTMRRNKKNYSDEYYKNEILKRDEKPSFLEVKDTGHKGK